MAVDQLGKGADDGTVLGQSATDKISMYGVTPVAQRANAAQVAVTDSSTGTSSDTVTGVPVGGVGAAAGGWDTAANRDAAITRINNFMATFATKMNEVRTVLVNLGLMKGAA